MYLCVHGHFYQPPREDPITGTIPREPGAEPFANFNEKIDAECYRPNALLGNFRRISFDIGPTLTEWMEWADPETLQAIASQDSGNAMAQAFNHTILPLATRRDKVTQVRWGVAEFHHRFGRAPSGMWLPETAVDTETLEVLAEAGITFTILAPWQAAEEPEAGVPGLVHLPSGRSVTVFFFDAALSGSVSFDPNATRDARAFARGPLWERRNGYEAHDRLLLIASDGELYGHHQKGREHFLADLLQREAPAAGFVVTDLASYLKMHPATREVRLREPTSWSCHHGVARWLSGCPCTGGDPSWKWNFRRALDVLAGQADEVCEDRAKRLLADFWTARDEYVYVMLGVEKPHQFLARHQARKLTRQQETAALALLEAQAYLQRAFTSCAFFWEDLDRLEPRYVLGYAARAIRLLQEAGEVDLEPDFLQRLRACRSWRSGKTGEDLYLELAARAGRGD